VLASGVPAKLKSAEKVTVRLEGRYYFGKPVTGGRVECLVRADGGRPLAEAEAALDAEEEIRGVGIACTTSRGKYLVACTLTDDSDRTASAAVPLEVEGIAPRGGLAKVPLPGG
jgi:uncharacterized protein YfaS (alpha-2-macroglobulin family)